MRTGPTKHYLLASDFDQTLSFNDSGHVLSEMLGVRDFEQKVTGLARSNLVQHRLDLSEFGWLHPSRQHRQLLLDERNVHGIWDGLPHEFLQRGHESPAADGVGCGVQRF